MHRLRIATLETDNQRLATALARAEVSSAAVTSTSSVTAASVSPSKRGTSTQQPAGTPYASSPRRFGGDGTSASSPRTTPGVSASLVARLKEQVGVLQAVLAQRDAEIVSLKQCMKATRVQELEQQHKVC